MIAAREPTAILLVAGGTGGHVYPALAVAAALDRSVEGAMSVVFAVDARPASAEAVTRAGYPVSILPIRHGLQRGAVLANLAVACDLLRSLAAAFTLLRRVRPAAVVGFGAYVTVPVVVVARALRIPVVVHEQNGRAGMANRLAVRLGARAAISIPGTVLARAVLTGNPVRPEIVDVERRPVSPPLIGIVGASLGAVVLNDAALSLYDLWRARPDVAVLAVTGARHYESCAVRLASERRPDDVLDFTLVPYEHDMASLYGRASVMVTRGGGSVAELAAAAMPAVVVPWSGAAEDHQTANAEAFAAAGAAIHLPERDCTGARLAAELDALLADPGRLATMASAARDLARPDAADAVAALARAAAA